MAWLKMVAISTLTLIASVSFPVRGLAENGPPTEPGSDRSVVKIAFQDRDELNELAILGEPWEVDEGHIVIDVTGREMEWLKRRGFSVEVLFASRADFEASLDRPIPRAGPEGLYHSYTEMRAELEQLASLHPQIARVYDIGNSWEKDNGLGDRDLWAIKISDNVATDEDESEILFLGCHHAREWISVEVPLYLAKHLVESYDTDPLVRSYVNHGEIWIVPMVNPDGHQYSVDVDRWWRKSRRYNGGGIYGVDLNRNYGYAWGGPGSSGDPSASTYRGPAPFSEPESQAIRSLGLSHDFLAVVSYHSYGQLVLYPWSYTYDPAPDGPLMNALATGMADLIRGVHGRDYTPQQGSDLYLASGTTDDWFYGELATVGFTIELRPVGYPYFELPESEIIPTWEENRPAALYLIGWTQSLNPPRPDVRANGSDGPLSIPAGAPLSVDVALEPGTYAGQRSDWWVAAESPLGRYWYTLGSGWVRSDTPVRAYDGALASVPPYEVLNTSTLGVGSYVFYFGVDLLDNGILDMSQLHYDRVDVTVE